MTITEFIDSAEPITQFGAIRIARFKSGDYWLEHDSGEGTSISENEMNALIEKLFNEAM